MRANLRRVFADAAREDDCVRAVHRRQICSDVLPRTVTENLHGETSAAVVVLMRFGQQLAHVVGQTRYSDETRLLVQQSLNLLRGQSLFG